MNQVGKQAYIAVFAYAIDPHRPQSGKWQACLLGSGTREATEVVKESCLESSSFYWVTAVLQEMQSLATELPQLLVTSV